MVDPRTQAVDPVADEVLRIAHETGVTSDSSPARAG
jgi:hypothetical protein